MIENNQTSLSTAEAKALLLQHGPNIVGEEKQLQALKILAAQLRSALIYVLIGAVIISFLLEDYKDAIIISLVVVLNVLIGFVQEYRAETSLKALNSKISKETKVIRDGKQSLIATSDIVPGDLVVLDAGTRVPADGRIIGFNELEIDEAVLTGESEPVTKDLSEEERSIVYKGSLVVGGTGMFRVTLTGAATKFGQIAKSLQSSADVITPVKKEIVNISQVVIYFVVFVSAVIALVGFSRGLELEEIYKTIVALGVSVIPEGLLIAFTVTLAIGMNRIMAKGAIVKSLPAKQEH